MANEKFKDKVVRMFTGDDDYDDEAYEDEGYEDDAAVEETADQDVVPSESNKKTDSYDAPLAGGAQVLVLSPEFFSDAPSIVNKIKESKTVVVNLKNTEYEDGRKIFDFLNGAVFALEGTINRIADNVFILAPKQVSVSTEMQKDEKDLSAKPMLDFDGEPSEDVN
ncbi:cell division protein SepF [Pseudoramibacter sp.]|jgi:cell division inhibitor SepF|uniref:cell division protein SepF n=1 Tax=Pseudoramibacter sp. TaxID=2034862 RepID=UPI0025DD426A|nr:cell division protein SepF [Pseudoramibacter sp.]MCH4072710.1 cell division protein SepF [Pseudoramibacter sp.]MCH4106481.1 cell division protein SepF [Pseudoramibacter sp.]